VLFWGPDSLAACERLFVFLKIRRICPLWNKPQTPQRRTAVYAALVEKAGKTQAAIRGTLDSGAYPTSPIIWRMHRGSGRAFGALVAAKRPEGRSRA
jgi:hypothetical protein